MKKIKILQAIRQGQIGGGESHVLDLVSHIDHSKYEPVVLSFTDGPMVSELYKKGITTHIIHTQKPFHRSIWKHVKMLMINEGIQMVHAHGTRALSNVYKSSKKLNLPLLYTVHGWSFHPDQPLPIRVARQQIESFLTKKTDKTICVSKSNQYDGIKRFNVQRSQVIHNSVNLEKFNINNSYKDIRNELDIDKSTFLIGYIVRITAQKDPFTMLIAMKKLLELNSNVKLLMVGDGDLKQKVIAKANDLGISQHIIFQPFRTDIPDILNAVDVYCLPSLWEGFPIGILESMAMKVPVVATPVDGTKELITNQVTGVLTPAKNPVLLAESISKLIENPKWRIEIANNAYEYVTTNFNVNQQVKKIEQVYKEVANSKFIK